MQTAARLKAIERACRAIETRDPAPDLAALARDCGLSPWHFQRLFSAVVGVSPKRYAMAQRRRRLSDSLRQSASVTQAIYAAGYPASSSAYRDGAVLGMHPDRLRRGGARERIRYATTKTRLGPIVVAATDRGVCLVEFLPASAAATRVAQRFPQARVEPADAELGDWLRRVVSRIEEPELAAQLPLDIRGTAFQVRVWRALTRIPAGRVESYGELARSIGAPRGSRAVARACATNELAVVVPCHRIVGSTGSLTGYRWGLDRKRRLLQDEGHVVKKYTIVPGPAEKKR